MMALGCPRNTPKTFDICSRDAGGALTEDILEQVMTELGFVEQYGGIR